MKFIEGNTEAIAEELLSISSSLNHNGLLDVVATTRTGFLVHDDVFDQYHGVAPVPPARRAEPSQRKARKTTDHPVVKKEASDG